MKTIFSANRKSLREPQFICVTLRERQPDYSLFYSRKARNAYGKDRGIVYAINVYPKVKEAENAEA